MPDKFPGKKNRESIQVLDSKNLFRKNKEFKIIKMIDKLGKKLLTTNYYSVLKKKKFREVYLSLMNHLQLTSMSMRNRLKHNSLMQVDFKIIHSNNLENRGKEPPFCKRTRRV